MAEQQTLATRMRALGEAVELSRGRAPEDVVAAASDVVKRAGERIAISGDHTVVAIAGATGSGKSATFNALTGTQLAKSGVTRPTTSDPMACCWGSELPTKLLDWLDVPRRHLIPTADGPMTNLVLIDLPDHDSTEKAHRMTVDRMVPLVDMLIWIVDPQKYADAALHDGYLKPLAPYADVMVVVLNQADRLAPEQLTKALTDLRALLDREGLAKSPVMAMSALTGMGVKDVRALLETVVRDKTMTAKRFATDVTERANALGATLGDQRLPKLDDAVADELNEALGTASGVPIVERGVLEAWRYRGTLATGWPVLKWLKRFKPDPLKMLKVGFPTLQLPGASAADPGDTTARTSLPKATPVQKAAMDAALRKLIDQATAGLPRGWIDSIRTAARGGERVLADRLDGAIASADLSLKSGTGWWWFVDVLQWLLFAAALTGLVWLALPLAFVFFQLPIALPHVTFWGWPAPTVLVALGVAGGLVLAGISRIGVEIGARFNARAARGILMERIARVTSTDVLAPVQAELDRL
ncbi:MAG TPA: 50S ribosome-binding GTPase, partial [Propioniciclava tarda]|nr:50S ribosome-binding GTPase [Propioniciclava tarda]